MPKTESNKKSKEKSILGLILDLFAIIWKKFKINKYKEEIQNNQQTMQEEWNKIDAEQHEEFSQIDSMSLEDLKDKINKK